MLYVIDVKFDILFCRLCLAIIIALPAATPNEFKNSAKYAFGDFTNCKFSVSGFPIFVASDQISSMMSPQPIVSGWPNGFAFILGFQAPLWTICK